jgi:hypothetical protein
MPEITLTLTDDEMAQLERVAASRNQDPIGAILYVIRRDIFRVPAGQRRSLERSTPQYKRRGADRLARQVSLVAHIKQHGHPESKAHAQVLADKFGVSARTIYRDLELAQEAIDREAGDPAVLPAPGPRPRMGRPPKVPRYRHQAATG